MATIKFIASGSSASNAFSTGALGPWGTSTACYIAVITAYSAADTITHTVTGGGATWSVVGATDNPYASRRCVWVGLANQVPTDTALTITASGGTTYAESLWCAFEIAEYDSGGVNAQGPDFQSTTGATALGTNDVGAPTGGQLTVGVLGVESGSASAILTDGGTTLVGSEQYGSTDVRAMAVGSSATDATPSFTWTTSSAAGVWGFRTTTGSTGAHDAGGGGGATPHYAFGLPFFGPLAGPIG